MSLMTQRNCYKCMCRDNTSVVARAKRSNINIGELFLQETIKDQVANMYLWPKTLEVQILDPSKYVFLTYRVCYYILHPRVCHHFQLI